MTETNVGNHIINETNKLFLADPPHEAYKSIIESKGNRLEGLVELLESTIQREIECNMSENYQDWHDGESPDDDDIRKAYLASGKTQAERFHVYGQDISTANFQKYLFALSYGYGRRPDSTDKFYISRLKALLTTNRYESRRLLIYWYKLLSADSVQYFSLFVSKFCRHRKLPKNLEGDQKKIIENYSDKFVTKKNIDHFIDVKIAADPGLDDLDTGKASITLTLQGPNHRKCEFERINALVLAALIHRHWTNDEHNLHTGDISELLSKYPNYKEKSYEDELKHPAIISKINAKLKESFGERDELISKLNSKFKKAFGENADVVSKWNSILKSVFRWKNGDVKATICIQGSINTGWKLEFLRQDKLQVSPSALFLHKAIPDSYNPLQNDLKTS